MAESNGVVHRRTPNHSKVSLHEQPKAPAGPSSTVQHETNLLSATEKGTASTAAPSIISMMENEIEREIEREERALAHFWARLNGAGRKKVPVLTSIKNCMLSSCA